MAESELVLRLRRIEGQIKGVQRMLEEGRACRDVLTQLMAVRSAIDQVGVQVLDAEICRCVGDADQSEAARDLQETMRMWTRYERR
jgi:DNA-binding FrmR family transcriptional regulator